NPSMGSVQPITIPPLQPILLPIAAEEGNGVIVQEIPQFLPQPEAQSGFRPSATTTPPPPPSSSHPGLFPSPTLTCSSIRCPSGSICRMETNRRTRRDEPVCLFNGPNSPSSCSQVRCSNGFDCEMQQSSSCSHLPCPLNPVCVQSPSTPSPPVVSCDSVRCGTGTVCRIQTVDHCTFAPCAVQAICISPCSSVNCPSNSQCKVDERTMATACVPNAPSQSPSPCSGFRCGFGERCAIVK
ncbi:hypothetical protein PENTCL1PPCAC_2160, partial [Pristionchus entomophagus]